MKKLLLLILFIPSILFAGERAASIGLRLNQLGLSMLPAYSINNLEFSFNSLSTDNSLSYFNPHSYDYNGIEINYTLLSKDKIIKLDEYPTSGTVHLILSLKIGVGIGQFSIKEYLTQTVWINDIPIEQYGVIKGSKTLSYLHYMFNIDSYIDNTIKMGMHIGYNLSNSYGSNQAKKDYSFRGLFIGINIIKIGF